jgi:hypothetical protein
MLKGERTAVGEFSYGILNGLWEGARFVGVGIGAFIAMTLYAAFALALAGGLFYLFLLWMNDMAGS